MEFLPFKPGLVGGHCIGVDPYYLTYKAKKEGYTPKIILAGREINDSMGSWVGAELIKIMKKNSILIEDSNVLILGLAFKENCNDIRNTKIKEIINCLEKHKVNLYIVDPYVDLGLANKKVSKISFSELPKQKNLMQLF